MRRFQSDIVVTGVPTKSYRLPSEWIKKGEWWDDAAAVLCCAVDYTVI